MKPPMSLSKPLRSSLLTTLGCALAATATVASAASFKVTLIGMSDDPDLDRNRVERAYPGHATGPASDAVQGALKDARLELESVGAEITLETVLVDTPEAAKAAAAKAEKGGQAALLTSLPPAWTVAVADAVKVPVINVGSAANSLREKDCRARLLHTLPSERMRADALAQTLAASRWSQVLLLSSASPEDVVRAEVAQAAIKRYGLKLAGTKTFKLSADPRERDLANPRLLTTGNYDAVWVVDSDGEFARSLPFRTVLPRPVVGDAGLTALAWHAQFERFGAPQVTRRFARGAGRAMSAHDWAGWMAGKALAAAAVAAPKGPVAAFGKALEAVELDGYKGVSMSFRTWDGQLRQPMLMTDGQGVIGKAPVEGLLHPRNVLDTLGADQPEKLCKARS